MTRRAARVDANQSQIVSALEAAGASVQSLAPLGKGCPDLLVARGNAGAMWLVEVKNRNGKDDRKNPHQKKWREAWNGPVYVVYEPDEALRLIGILK